MLLPMFESSGCAEPTVLALPHRIPPAFLGWTSDASIFTPLNTQRGIVQPTRPHGEREEIETAGARSLSGRYTQYGLKDKPSWHIWEIVVQCTNKKYYEMRQY